MAAHTEKTYAVKALTSLVWLALAASMVYWSLRFSADRSLPSYSTTIDSVTVIDSASVARALGATGLPANNASTESRFVLLGVVAASQDTTAALIAVDGKPAQTFRVGSAVADQVFLKSASGRQAVLSSAPAGTVLTTLDMVKLRD